MRILLVDDNDKTLNFHKRLFESNGFEVETAKNGIEALSKAKEKTPDLVISDILMPEMDGFTFCKNWHEDETLQNIPFVFYSAVFTDNEDEQFAYELGARAFIKKPVDTDVFLKIINSIFEKQNKRNLTEPVADQEKLINFCKRYSARLQKVLEDKIEELNSFKETTASLEEEKKHFKERYEQLKKNFFDILDSMSYLAAIHKNGEIIYANKAAKEAFLANEENPMEGKKLNKLVHPDYLLGVQERILRLTQKKENIEPTIERLVRFDGSYFDAETQGFVILLDGEPHFLVVARDVSETYRTEHLLNLVREIGEKLLSAKTLKDIFDTVADRLQKINVATVLLTLDEKEPERLVAKYFKHNSPNIQFIHSLFGEKLKPQINLNIIDPDYLYRKEKRTKYNEDYTYLLDEFFDKSKAAIIKKIVEESKIKTVIASPLFIENEFKGLLVFQSNKLKEKDTEIFAALANQFSLAWQNVLYVKELQENLDFYKAITETAEAAVFIYSGEHFVYINNAMGKITGYSKDEILNMNFWKIIAPEHRELVKERGLRRQRGEDVPNSYNFKIKRKDGVERWVHFTARRTKWKGKDASLGIAFDISDIIEQNLTK